MTREQAEALLKRTRNAKRKAYTAAWIKHAFDGAPEPERGDLSYMAAQGVRLEIGFPPTCGNCGRSNGHTETCHASGILENDPR